jgi:ribose transport system substrate-binding protein
MRLFQNTFKQLVLAVFIFCFSTSPLLAKLKFGLVLSNLQNPFFLSLKQGAIEESYLNDIELVILDSQDSVSREKGNIQKLIAQEVDFILLNPINAEKSVAMVIRSNKAGIPIMTLDRNVKLGNVVSYIASDNVAGGYLAGEHIAKKIGESGKVVELEGIAGTSAATERGKGFNKAIAQYPNISVVSRKRADFNRTKGFEEFEKMLRVHHKIDAVFAHNDEMILGAIDAADVVNRQQTKAIVFVGFDAVDDAVKALNKGSLSATIAQQPEEIGKKGVQVAVQYLNGQSVKSFYPVPLRLVTGG